MGRYYRLSKKISKEQEKRIKRELEKQVQIPYVKIDFEKDKMKVITDNEYFMTVMSIAVNVCSHVADCQISFAGFALS